MENLLKEVRYSLRSLARSPGFTAVALLTLVLGIGANSAIFSVVNAVLLRPLPYPDAERIVRLWGDYANRDLPPLDASEGEYYDYRDQGEVFEHISAFVSLDANLTGGDGEPERVLATYTSGDFFQVLGSQTAAGRVYGAAEDQPGGPAVAVISHRLWQNRYGADPGILGKPILMNGHQVTVLGVMPPGFEYPAEGDLWSPMGLDRAQQAPRGQRYLGVIARRKPAVSLEQAQTQINTVAARFHEQDPALYGTDSGWGVRLVPLLDELIGDTRKPLSLLLAAVALVLLIACVNVANLLLSRAQVREREQSIRVALGASRTRLFLQAMTESLLLALIGGALGLLAADWALGAFLAVNPDPVPRADEIRLDAGVAAFTFGLSLLTGLVLGLVSAVQAFRANVQETIKEGGGKASAGRGHFRFRRVLVGLEVALALVLLIGAGLMIKSFALLRQVDPGFQPENLLTMEISVPRSRYPEDRQVAQFYDQLLDRIGGLPGVVSASSVSLLPLSGGETRSGSIGEEGRSYTPGDPLPEPEWRSIDHRYFRTMGIPVLRGRAFTASDDDKAFPMAVIDKLLADQLWPNQDAVGKRFKMGAPTEDNPAPWVTVIGVAGETKMTGLSTEPRGAVYFPQLRRIERAQSIVVRTQSADPLSVADSVRREIRSMNPDQAISNLRTMEDHLAGSYAQPRFAMLLMAAFAAVAAVLAAVGIYGVVAYTVTQRTHEIGVRLALGAQRGDVLKMIVGQGMLVVVVGVVCGLFAAFLLTRAMAGLLYNVETTDLAIFAGVPLLLAAVALAANLLPARRAVRIEPVTALRYE
jgi:putative ABC transport system permease protein